ncbi:unnamed protein product, partial [Rotaria sp. Silwood2]
LSSFPLRSLIPTSNELRIKKICSNRSSAFPRSKLLLNLTFYSTQIYHHNAIAYDYYSKSDLGQARAGDQWKIWPLPLEKNRLQNNTLPCHVEISPFVVSRLPFVDKVFVITNPRLTKRHDNLKKALVQQGISVESIEWRMKWNSTTCNSNSSHSYVYKQLNLKDKPLGN